MVGCSQILFDLLEGGIFAITDLRNIDNVLRLIQEYPNVNDLLFQSAEKQIEFTKIKKVFFNNILWCAQNNLQRQ